MQQQWRAVVLGLALCAPLPVLAQALPVRSFERFQFDTGTSRGVWGELRVTNFHFDFDKSSYLKDVDLLTIEPILAYGGEQWEVGTRIPFGRLDAEYCVGPFGCFDVDESGIQDMQLYGKMIFRSEYFHAGGGMDFSLPTGDEEKGLGSGEFGVAPYGTAAVVLGPVELRTHIGKLFFPDAEDGYYVQGPDEVLFYGGGAFASVADLLALRLEVVGARADRDEFENLVTIDPGIDFRIPIGAVDLLLRLNGSAGVTDAAPDWGIGGSLVVFQAQ